MSKQQKGTSNKEANPNILRRALDGVDIRPVGLLNLGLKSWQTALDRSHSIARLAERHNQYGDFSRNLGFSHVVPLSMPRLDMRVVSRYLRLDTAFRPLDRTMRMKRQPEQAQTQSRQEVSQRFRPTLPNPNDFRRSEDVIERLLEPESPTYYDEPDSYYAEQLDADLTPLTPFPGEELSPSTVGEGFGERSTQPSALSPQSYETQPSALSPQSSIPALARVFERIDTPLSVNNPYAEEVGGGLVAPSFEVATPAPLDLVYRSQESGARNQEAGVRSQNNAANLTPPTRDTVQRVSTNNGEVQGEASSAFSLQPSAFETRPSVRSPQSFETQHAEPPALARAMERMDTPLSVNNPAAEQVGSPNTPVFGNFEVASPEMVHRTIEQVARSQEQGARIQNTGDRTQESGVRSQNSGANLTPPTRDTVQRVSTNNGEVQGEASSAFSLQPSAFAPQHSEPPALMRAMERMETPLSVNNIFAEQPIERQAITGGGDSATVASPAMVYRTPEQGIRSQEQGARSQNSGDGGQGSGGRSQEHSSFAPQTYDTVQRINTTNLIVQGEASSSFIPQPSSFETQHSPALARALERIDTPITVNNVFAEQPGARATSPALETAAAFSPTMVHRVQEQENRGQEPVAKGQNSEVGGRWMGDRSQEQGVSSQHGGANLTPPTRDTVQRVSTNNGEVQGEASSAFSLQPSAFETRPSVRSPQSFETQHSPALARALERIDTPITVNNVFAEQPGERPLSPALEAANAASPAMIHRSQEQGVRSQNSEDGGQGSGVRSQKSEVKSQNDGANLTPLTPFSDKEQEVARESFSAFSPQPSASVSQHSPALARAIERLNEQTEVGFSRTESSSNLTQRSNPAMPTSSSQLGLEPATPAMVHRVQEQEARIQESGARSQNGGANLNSLPKVEGGASALPQSFESQSSESPALTRAIQRLEEQIAAEENRTEAGFFAANPPAQAAELATPALLLRKAGDYVPETREENRIRPTEEANPFAAQPAPQSLADALDMLHLLPSMRETAKQNTGTTVARQAAGDNGVATVGGEAHAAAPSNPILNAVMRSMDSGAAKPLEGGVQSRLSGMFGRNFEHVRVHTDDHAAEATSHMGAEAFTVGHSIFFAPGRYQPESSEGQALIGHELTHVMQNATLPSLGNGRVLEASSDHQHLEREAQQVERTILRHLEPSPYTPIQTNVSRSLASTPAPAPMVERSVAPVESVHLRPADSGAIARQAEPGSYIEREIGSYNSIQRAVTIDEMETSASGNNGQGGGKMSDEELAEKVFKLLKERLIIERERHGLRGGSYF